MPSTPGSWLSGPEVPGFRFKVRLTGGGMQWIGVEGPGRIAETLCVSADVPCAGGLSAGW